MARIAARQKRLSENSTRPMGGRCTGMPRGGWTPRSAGPQGADGTQASVAVAGLQGGDIALPARARMPFPNNLAEDDVCMMYIQLGSVWRRCRGRLQAAPHPVDREEARVQPHRDTLARVVRGPAVEPPVESKPIIEERFRSFGILLAHKRKDLLAFIYLETILFAHRLNLGPTKHRREPYCLSTVGIHLSMLTSQRPSRHGFLRRPESSVVRS